MDLRPARRAAARCAAIALCIAAALADTAVAEQPAPPFWLYDRSPAAATQHGQFFAALGSSGGIQQLPRFNSNVSFFDAAGQVSLGTAAPFSADLGGVQPGGEIGFVFRDGTFPAWAGRRVRAAVYGSIFHGEAETSRRTRTPDGVSPFIEWRGVSGAFVGFRGILPAGTEIGESLKVERDAFQIGLKLESDIALGRDTTLTPAIAVFGGRSSDSYVYTTGLFFPGVSEQNPSAVNERLRTTEIGGHLGARLAWQFRPGWALLVGGTAGPVWQHSRMTAQDCLVLVIFPTGVPCGPGNFNFLTTSASDSRSTVGFRGTASLGIAADLRYAVISLGGFMRYDSQIPGIRNPQQAGGFSTAALGPARIRFDDGFAYGGFVTLRVKLPN